MAEYPGFIGGSATVRSRNVDCERTVNFYPEAPPGTPKAKLTLEPTPGLEPFTVLSAGPVRALFAQNGRAFAVGGAVFYELLASGNALIRGGVAFDGRPATISSNGTNGGQLFITSGGLGYIYSLTTNVLTQITAPDFPTPCIMGLFSDGYFIALKQGTNQFNISGLYDGTAWDALDTYLISTVADPARAIAELHRDIYVFGEQTTGVWSNTGDADTPYQPIPGVKIDMGCAAAFSVANIDNSLMWLGQSIHGDRVVWRANGYTPERVSTHAVEYALSRARRIDDAIAYAYQENGHTFYVLYVPDLANVRTWETTWETTWVYDVATGLWHERALWDSVNMQWQPHLSRCHAFGFGRHLVGDRLSPAVYTMRQGLATDGQVVVGVVPTFAQPVVSYASTEEESESSLAYGEDVTVGSLLTIQGAFTAWDAVEPEIIDTQGNRWTLQHYDGFSTAGDFSATAVASASGPLTVTVTPHAPSWFSFCLREILNAGPVAAAGTRHSGDPAVTQFTAGLTAAQPAGTIVMGGWTTAVGPSPEPVASAPFTQDVEIDLTNIEAQAFSGTYYRVPSRRVADPTWTISPASYGSAQALAAQPGRLTPVPTVPPPAVPVEVPPAPIPPVDPGGDPDVTPPPPPTDPTPTVPGDLELADIDYLGSANAELDGFSYQEGQVAVRYVSGQRRLLMVKALRGDLVEVTLPTLSGDITTASNITVVRSWANWQWTPTGQDAAELANGWHIGSNMYVDEDDNDVLWYTIWPEYFGSPNYPLPFLAAVRLHDDGTVTKYGPWYYRDTTSAGWKKVCMRIVPIPTELRAAFGGRKVCLSAAVLGASGGSETNWGPGAYAVHLPSLGSTDPIEEGIAIADYSPNAGLAWPYYHCFRDSDYTSTASASLPAAEASHGYWQASSDKAWPAVWLAGDKKGFLHIGNLAHGQTWYGQYNAGPGGAVDTMQSPAGSSAFYSSDWRPAAWIYVHSDLVERAAGTRAKHSYGMQPRLISENWPSVWTNVHRPSGWPYVSPSEGFAFDAVTRQLIWVHPFARIVGFGRYPEIHVLQLPS